MEPQYNELLYNEGLSLTNVFLCLSNVQGPRISEFNCKFINAAKKNQFFCIATILQLIYCKIFSKIWETFFWSFPFVSATVERCIIIWKKSIILEGLPGTSLDDKVIVSVQEKENSIQHLAKKLQVHCCLRLTTVSCRYMNSGNRKI